MKKVIVFGATGSLGAYISIFLKEKGYMVYAVGRRKNVDSFFAKYGIPYISLDISDNNSFKALPTDIYAILHFAGALPAGMKGYDASLYISSIIQGTLNVLEYARLAKVDRIVYPQSLFDVSYLFGSKIPIPENSLRKAPLDGDHSTYVIAKNAAVDLIEHYYTAYGIKRFILRLSRVYLYHPNPYTYTNGVKHMVSDRYLIYQALEGRDIELWGDPDLLLETICIKDFLQIVEKALEVDTDGGLYNIGSGGSTLQERIEGIIHVFSPPSANCRIIYKPEKRSSMQFTLDISKTIAELGYRPRYKWIDYLYDFKREMEEQRFEELWGKENNYIL